MSIESRDGMTYEGPGSDIPDDIPPRRRSRKMAKTPKTDAPAKEKRSMTRLEVFQTVVIFVFITAIAAFIGGMQFQKSQQAEIKAAVSAVQIAPATADAKK
jgi:hypothetical protein